MKNISLISDVSTQKRQLETTFDGNSQKRFHVDDDNDFFGLPHKVKHLFKKHKRITQLYDWQIECLNLEAIKTRKNLIYALPTSGGKTLVAEILMLKELILYERNVIFILPYVALVQEKVQSLCPFGLNLEFNVEEYVGGKGKHPPIYRKRKSSLYVCTLERGAGLVDCMLSDNGQLGGRSVGMIVVDELHLLGEQKRGALLEATLTKVLDFKQSKDNIQIIGMSATIGNMQEIGDFLNAHVYTRDFRPVKLTETIKLNEKIFVINKDIDGSLKIKLDRKLNFEDYSTNLKQLDPSGIGLLVREILPHGSCLIFCPTKSSCQSIAKIIYKTIGCEETQVKLKQKEQLYKALKEEGDGKVCPLLSRSILFGVAYHNSGLTNAERKLIEEAFLDGILKCICCTSTLAAGVNLPAQRVIITSPYVGRDFMKQSTYRQMVGRAGRAGLTESGDSILLFQENDKEKIKVLLESGVEHIYSCLGTEENVVYSMILSSVSTGCTSSQQQLVDLMKRTLFIRQAEKNNTECTVASDLVESCLDKLKSINAFDKPIGDKLKLTSIAKAAVAANLDILEAQKLYAELLEASSALILTNKLHLLYLAVPYTECITIERQNVLDIMTNLQGDQQVLANRLGLNELCISQFFSYGKIKNVSESIWNKFLMSLILNDLWNKESIWTVSKTYNLPRGTIHSFLSRTASHASSILRFTEALNDKKLDHFPMLFQNIVPKLNIGILGSSSDLESLMSLPSVRFGRATQLYKAGYKTLNDVAKANKKELCNVINHLPLKVAREMIASAKLMLLSEAEALEELAESLRADLNQSMSKNKDNSLWF
ncbi:PREDICTED: helicase POLQ-like [Diuraphis noxia]|uniref:helicase POLQ-like n=1 Tax=Diuraphis noxia TaxID=143948 RepID=UPI0007635F50|nr:PREDICTED: helicase POLQ-like [Diuraphis noxia]